MAIVVPIKDHPEQGLALRIGQYKEKPRLERLFAVFLWQVQLLEDAVYDLLVKRFIDNATGAQLDLIGKIVGEKRLGRDDDEYRLFIRVRVQINRANATAPSVLTVLAMLTAPTPAFYDEFYPASFAIELADEPERDPRQIFYALQDTRAAGVRCLLISATTTPNKQFLYSNYGDADVAANGWGNAGASDTTTGLFATAVGSDPPTPWFLPPTDSGFGAGAGLHLRDMTPKIRPSTLGGTVTILGDSFVAGATVSVGGTPATGIVVVSPLELTATMPVKPPGNYDVSVTNPDGSTSSFGYAIYTAAGPPVASGLIMAPPLISSPHHGGTPSPPARGPLAGGGTAIITGSNFGRGATVSVGGVAVTNVAWLSSTQIKIIFPAGTVGLKDIVVTNPDGQTGTLEDAYTYALAPTITSITPNTSPIAGGTTVVIAGLNFFEGAVVRISGTSAPYVNVDSPTQITAVVPPNPAATYDVVVQNTDGQIGVYPASFTYA
jgi:hypothetical protein